MQTIHNANQLREAILLLETTKAEEAARLKEKLHDVHESLKPVNLVKSAVQEVSDSPALRQTILNTAVTITAGYLVKRVAENQTVSPVKKMMGTALIYGVATALIKHPEVVESLAKGLISALSGTSEKQSVTNKTENNHEANC